MSEPGYAIDYYCRSCGGTRIHIRKGTRYYCATCDWHVSVVEVATNHSTYEDDPELRMISGTVDKPDDS